MLKRSTDEHVKIGNKLYLMFFILYGPTELDPVQFFLVAGAATVTGPSRFLRVNKSEKCINFCARFLWDYEGKFRFY